MKQVVLRPSGLSYDHDLLKMLADIPENETGFSRGFQPIGRENIMQFLEKLYNSARNINIEPGKVRSTTYWAYDGQELIGIGRLRGELTQNLLKHGGHCGYYVRPEYRGKGYASAIMWGLKEMARQKGIGRLLLTCDVENLASAAVIIKNGGVEDVIFENNRRFWIDL